MTTVDTTSTSTTSTLTSSSISTSTSSDDTDWDALVEVAVAQKQLPADTIEVKIAENETEIEAYETMQGLLQDITSSLDIIRGTDDSLTENDDIFSVREAYTTANGDVDASSAVVITADDGADIQTYDLKILQLAKAQKVASESQSSETDAIGMAGTFSLQLDGGDELAADAVEIEVDSGMSLADIAEAINAESSLTGISASIIEVSSTEFKLVLNADDTGQDITMASVDGDDIGQSLGIVDAAGAFTNELQASQDSIFSIDGIEITRDTNTVDDVVDGVTFSLYQTTGEDDSISVEISQSLSEIKTSVQSIVDSYNAYREWALTQQETASGGGASDDAVLFGDGTLRNVNNAIADALSSMVDEDSMALLGLSYDNSNYLELDESVLNDALLNDLDGIESLLNFQMTSSSSDLVLLNRNGTMPSSLSLDVTVDEDGVLAGVSVDGDDSLFEVKGSRIVGAEGSDYEGITFVFTGSEDMTIDITTSTGIVENLYQAVSGYSDEDDGLITDIITSLEDENSNYEDSYEAIMSTVEDYRDRLITLYASYQEKISEAESSLDYLEALFNTGD
ncbi:flagellar filament capping protein FliD [Cohaesibacter celericrescens]|uniref:Flagellar hook-associated protein 2 n=1 Tax=Cohaesibacter celericrescens TaxID=2067669 RepID=A0A2N5XPT3_9HYPH|nr:flagellar filament capping protein FliD [Cohaesibacter celericrescens]PLW76447.1 flagellar hook protein [Cohaesibacter celericrescens]